MHVILFSEMRKTIQSLDCIENKHCRKSFANSALKRVSETSEKLWDSFCQGCQISFGQQGARCQHAGPNLEVALE